MTEKVISRREFLKVGVVYTIMGIVAPGTVLAVDGMMEKHKLLEDSYTGPLLDCLEKNSGKILEDYASTVDGYFEVENSLSRKAVKIEMPFGLNILPVRSSFLIEQNNTRLIVIPRADSFKLDDENNKVIVNPRGFYVTLHPEDDPTLDNQINMDSVNLYKAKVKSLALLSNIYPGPAEKAIKSIWPGSEYGYNGGWDMGNIIYKGFEISQDSTWKPADGGEHYTLQLNRSITNIQFENK
ncbi:MAG TPA: hypothetical protein VI819_02790 [Patescibacteria group bacterium]|nr:hypothetical protein [Patescibacteria group bacterium]